MTARVSTAEMGDTKMYNTTNQDAFWDDMTQSDLKNDDRVKTVATKKLSKEDKEFQAAARAAGLASDAGLDLYGQDISTVDRIQKGISDAADKAGKALKETAKETKTILVLVAVAAFFVSRAYK